MELPVELARIVNEYAKPVFTHFKKYNQVLREREVVEWPSLKQRLLEPNVEPVLKAMDDYLKAKQFYKNASKEYDDLPFMARHDWTEQEQEVAKSSANCCNYLLWRVLVCAHDLNQVIHHTQSEAMDFDSWNRLDCVLRLNLI